MMMVIKMKKQKQNKIKIGGNIPGGNFLGGNFPGRSFPGT